MTGEYVDLARGILLKVKEGEVKHLPLFAKQRGVGVSSCNYMIDI
jgi:hypothetical protein